MPFRTNKGLLLNLNSSFFAAKIQKMIGKTAFHTPKSVQHKEKYGY